MQLEQIQKQVQSIDKSQLAKIKGGTKDNTDTADNDIIIVDMDEI